jgi:hypothetical protein
VRELHRPVRAALLAAVVVVVAGCDLLWAAYGTDPWAPPPAWVDEPFPQATVLASYSSGTATAEISRDGTVETITFDRVGDGSTLNGLIGASVTWRNDSGWVLSLNAYDVGSFLAPMASGESGPSSYSGDVTLQRINGSDFWRADSYGMAGSRCIVDIQEASETAVRGSATCRELRWTDGFAAPMPLEEAYIETEEPFDAEITFEATP